MKLKIIILFFLFSILAFCNNLDEAKYEISNAERIKNNNDGMNSNLEQQMSNQNMQNIANLFGVRELS